MQAVAVARNAMATRFEVLVYGKNPVALRAAAEEALDEIEKLDAQLNYYRSSSELGQINNRAFHHPIKTEPGLFRLLQRAKSLWSETHGAFDISIGPYMALWGLSGESRRMPSDEEILAVREQTGIQGVELDEKEYTVRFKKPGIRLDLGAIGKGYAIDVAVEILRDLGISDALIHGGTSTIYALGHPPEQTAWMVALDNPSFASNCSQPIVNQSEKMQDKPEFWMKIPLSNRSLSVSALEGKVIQWNGQTYGHILDPRTGYPVCGAHLAAVVLDSATESDALSTALLVMGEEGFDSIAFLRPDLQAIACGLRQRSHDIWLKSSGIQVDLSSINFAQNAKSPGS